MSDTKATPAAPVHFAEPMFSMPWHCGDRDCETSWHLGTYWHDSSVESGYTYDEFTDGDHEELDPGDKPPDYDEVAKAWDRYWRDTLETGADILEQCLSVKGSRKVKQTWQCKFVESIRGPILIGTRRNCRGKWLKTPPDHVAEYMLVKCIGGRWAVDTDAMSHDEYRELLNDGTETGDWQIQRAPRGARWMGCCTLEATIPRSAEVVTKEIKAVARKAIAAHKQGNGCYG